MKYKSIVLQLLQDRPELHIQLRSQRMLLPTMERYASELKASHEAWMSQLAQAKPDSDLSQLASEAMELAVEELEDRLPPVYPLDETATFLLDEAMTFIRRHTPTA